MSNTDGKLGLFVRLMATSGLHIVVCNYQLGFCDSVTVADVLGDHVCHLLLSPIVITIIHFVL